MPLLTGELLSAWREVERTLAGLPGSDPRAARCRALIDEMRETYQRLVDVYPRTQEDAEQVLQLIARAHALVQVDQGEAELEPA